MTDPPRPMALKDPTGLDFDRWARHHVELGGEFSRMSRLELAERYVKDNLPGSEAGLADALARRLVNTF